MGQQDITFEVESNMREDVPATLEAFVRLGKLRRYSEALQLFHDSLESRMTFFPVLAECIEVLVDQGDFTTANETIAKALEHHKYITANEDIEKTLEYHGSLSDERQVLILWSVLVDISLGGDTRRAINVAFSSEQLDRFKKYDDHAQLDDVQKKITYLRLALLEKLYHLTPIVTTQDLRLPWLDQDWDNNENSIWDGYLSFCHRLIRSGQALEAVPVMEIYFRHCPFHTVLDGLQDPRYSIFDLITSTEESGFDESFILGNLFILESLIQVHLDPITRFLAGSIALLRPGLALERTERIPLNAYSLFIQEIIVDVQDILSKNPALLEESRQTECKSPVQHLIFTMIARRELQPIPTWKRLVLGRISQGRKSNLGIAKSYLEHVQDLPDTPDTDIAEPDRHGLDPFHMLDSMVTHVEKTQLENQKLDHTGPGKMIPWLISDRRSVKSTQVKTNISKDLRGGRYAPPVDYVDLFLEKEKMWT